MTLRKAGCLVTSPTRCPSIHRSGGRARKPSMYSAPVRAAIPFASWWSESVEARTDVLLGLSVLPSGRLAADDAQLGPARVAGRGLPDPVQCQWAEVQLGFVRVMRAAAQLDVVDCRCATCRMRLHVVELQEAGRGAAAPRRPPERAPPPVPEPDGPRGDGPWRHISAWRVLPSARSKPGKELDPDRRRESGGAASLAPAAVSGTSLHSR